MEVKSTVYGAWTVDELVAACTACGSDDIPSARKAKPKPDETKKK